MARRKCPKCGSNSVARILYGYPIPSEELEKELEEGRIIMGGCCIPEFPTKWFCNQCSFGWNSRLYASLEELEKKSCGHTVLKLCHFVSVNVTPEFFYSIF